MPENNQKYGLVEDVDKFIETQGQEGVQAPENVPPAEVIPPVVPPVNVIPLAPYSIESDERYISLQAKLVELEGKKAPEINPQLKEIDEWAKRTNRPLEDWINFNSDPSKLSDIDVVRKTQQLKNPTLSEEELDFYIKDRFVSDPDLDTESEVMRKQIAFKTEVASGKELLESNRLKFDTRLEGNLTAEQRDEIAFAQQAREERTKNSELSDRDYKNLQAVAGLTDEIQLNLGDEKKISFKIAPESKKEQVNYIGEMKRWQNEDGSTNSKALLEDSYRLKHFDDIINVVYQQGLNDQIENSARQNANLSDPDKIHSIEKGSKFGFAGRSASKRYQV